MKLASIPPGERSQTREEIQGGGGRATVTGTRSMVSRGLCREAGGSHVGGHMFFARFPHAGKPYAEKEAVLCYVNHTSVSLASKTHRDTSMVTPPTVHPCADLRMHPLHRNKAPSPVQRQSSRSLLLGVRVLLEYL